MAEYAIIFDDEIPQQLRAIERKYHCRTLYEILGEANTRIQQGGGIPAEEFWWLVQAEHALEEK